MSGGALLVCSVLLLAQVDAPPDAELATQVRRLVRQLDERTKADRDEAESRLLQLGPAALAHLPDGVSEQQRTALSRIRQQLQQQEAEATVRPTTVTLEADAMPLNEVLETISSQTGNKLVDRRFEGERTNPKLKVSFKDTPFWQALDQTLDQANLAIYPFSEQAGLAIVARPEEILPRSQGAAYSGPFRIVASQVSARRDLRASQAAADREGTLVVDIEIAWEPRLTPIVVQQAMKEVSATADDGSNLPAANPDARREAPARGQAAAVQFSLPLTLPPRSVEAISTLSGRATALIPGRLETFTFDNLKRGMKADQRKAGATVTLADVRKNQDVWELLVQVRYDEAAGALQSHYTWYTDNEAVLVAKDGKQIEHVGFETAGQRGNEFSLLYLFEVPELTDLKLQYRTPGVIQNVPIDFKLENIPLP